MRIKDVGVDGRRAVLVTPLRKELQPLLRLRERKARQKVHDLLQQNLIKDHKKCILFIVSLNVPGFCIYLKCI